MLLLPNEVRPTKEFQFPFRPRKLDESYTMTLISAIKKSNLDFCIASTSKVWPLGRHPNKDVTLVEFKCPLIFYRSQIILELFKKFKARLKSFDRVKIILSNLKKKFKDRPKTFDLVQIFLYWKKNNCSMPSLTVWPMTKYFDPTQWAQKSSGIIGMPGQKLVFLIFVHKVTQSLNWYLDRNFKKSRLEQSCQ